MSLPRQSFGIKMDKADLMVGGVQNNLDQLARRDIDATSVTEFETQLAKVRATNQEQERLKAALKTETEKLDAEMKTLDLMYREFKKIVKLDFPSSAWKEFGLDDKH